MKEENKSPTASYTFLEPPSNQALFTDGTNGYQAHEFLRGWRLRVKAGTTDELERVPSTEGIVGIARPSIFGHCETSSRSYFMKNQKTQDCAVVFQEP